MTISKAQRRFLAQVAASPTGSRTPFNGGRRAGRDASAWYRTAASLSRMGLITLTREGDAQRATITAAGLDMARKVTPGPKAESQWPAPDHQERMLFRDNYRLRAYRIYRDRVERETGKRPSLDSTCAAFGMVTP